MNKNVIIKVVYENGERKLYDNLTETEKNEFRECITNKLIQAFARDLNRKGIAENE